MKSCVFYSQVFCRPSLIPPEFQEKSGQDRLLEVFQEFLKPGTVIKARVLNKNSEYLLLESQPVKFLPEWSDLFLLCRIGRPAAALLIITLCISQGLIPIISIRHVPVSSLER